MPARVACMSPLVSPLNYKPLSFLARVYLFSLLFFLFPIIYLFFYFFGFLSIYISIYLSYLDAHEFMHNSVIH